MNPNQWKLEWSEGFGEHILRAVNAKDATWETLAKLCGGHDNDWQLYTWCAGHYLPFFIHSKTLDEAKATAMGCLHRAARDRLQYHNEKADRVKMIIEVVCRQEDAGV